VKIVVRFQGGLMGNLKIVVFFLVILLLAGCLGTPKPEVTFPVESTTRLALNSPLPPTGTPDPTTRYQQTLQANQTQNAAYNATSEAKLDATGSARPPTATRSPTKVPTVTPWVVTQIPFIIETPTPLPTPSVDAAAYQLRAWDEASALELVEIAERFSFADNIPKPMGEKRFDYQADQAVISLAAQEALHRFPQADFAEKLQWRIALANSILDSEASDAWILQKIEDGLNSGQFTPDILNQMLNPYGFLVGERQSAPNLFGDNQTAQVLWITRLDQGYTGLYAALSQDDQEHYILTKIYSTWNFNFGYDGSWNYGYSFFEIGDHTGDDVPEVILFPGYHNGTFCGYDLVIYQYLKGAFVDISQDQFSFDECNAIESWQFGSPDENGAEPIETWRAAVSYTGVERYERYDWNGERYVLSESHLVPPEKLDDIARRWIVFAMQEEDYPNVIEKVKQFLLDQAQLQEVEPDFGPSYPDYLRFQLGLAYAFQSDVSLARETFEQIIQTPYNPLTTTLSSAAQAYLDHYHGDTDLYQACQAALQVMEQASGVYPFGLSFIDDFEPLLQGWGYLPDWAAESIALCDLSAAFRRIAAQLDRTQFAAAPDQLSQAGVLVQDAIEVDLDNDGQTEWVLMVNTPGDDAPVGIWVLLYAPTNVLALQVGNLYTLSEDAVIELGGETVVSPDGVPIAFIRAGEHLYVFHLDPVAQSFDRVLSESDVESYTFYQRDGRWMLEVVSDTSYCPHCKDIYYWFDDDFRSFYPDYPDEEAVIKAEEALLTDWKPEEAIPLLQDILSYPDYYKAPHMMYLLGLAYELIGDEQNAVRAYWNLWHNYPESAYARLAQAKLELRR
jgi:hypothetical protein